MRSILLRRNLKRQVLKPMRQRLWTQAVSAFCFLLFFAMSNSNLWVDNELRLLKCQTRARHSLSKWVRFKMLTPVVSERVSQTECGM